jgi:hypothetical protein
VECPVGRSLFGHDEVVAESDCVNCVHALSLGRISLLLRVALPAVVYSMCQAQSVDLAKYGAV